MKIRAGRVIIISVIVEFLVVIALFATGFVTMLSDPPYPAVGVALAQRAARWVGPVFAFVFCVLGGWWVARKVNADHVPNGVAVGGAAVVLDIALLVSLSVPFHPVFVLSEAGRLVGGWVGGRLARRPTAVSARSVSA